MIVKCVPILQGGAPPQFLRFILCCTLCFEGEYPNICIHALNNVPAPPLLQNCLHPCIGGVAKQMESFAFSLEWSWGE